MPQSQQWTVVDLFSGAGGMSYGFRAHRGFSVIGAADAQIGKPSTRRGTLGCNASYLANIGIRPVEADLSAVDPADVCQSMGVPEDGVTVLCACPPCTGFSRTLAQNHVRDDSRNTLVRVIADYARVLRPQIIVIENARELVMGRFSVHLRGLTDDLAQLGYSTSAVTHFLNDFGLPQRRERALVVAVRRPMPPRELSDLWSGYRVNRKATHVRRAIWDLPPVDVGQGDPRDPMHVSPMITSDANRRRLAATPPDGGGWVDLIDHPESEQLLTPSMKHRAHVRDFGSHPDVYGRLWWDRPAVTIKRECAHIGNGRYAHPEQNRLCTVREMSILQGFPGDYTFVGTLTNMYRHIGDAVPPLISYQLAALCEWILTGRRPGLEEMILPGCHLSLEDIEVVPQLPIAV
ncbi:MAG TPA: DNA cytosine methyltransferase [Streptosporangiaceae bacterium]|jgi:DNA (cytosine-5)-methyltransferase 1|nr:DNA cytosine methyltransferase [Streptosporangiaceae bacterium]